LNKKRCRRSLVGEPIETVHSFHSLSDVDKVEHDEVRVPVVVERSTVGGMGHDRVDSVGPGAVESVRDEDTTADGEDVGVEVVVDQTELLGRCEGASGSVDFAAEFAVSWIVFVLPDHLELGKDEVDGGLGTSLGAFVQEHDDPFARFDHLSECRPVIARHHRLGRNVRHVREAGLVEDGLPHFLDRQVFRVCENKGEDVVGVPVEEVLDSVQVSFDCSTIEKTAGGVAEVKFSVVHMRLSLQHPYAECQLSVNFDLLGSCQSKRVSAERKRVVRPEERHIAIFTLTQFCMAIT